MFFDYVQYEYHLAATLLVCAMLGMGTTLELSDFRRVIRAPQGVLLVLAMQLVLTPLLAIGLSRLLNVPPGVSVGLLVVAAIPGGLFSNVFTYFARGNVALSISATAVCTLACLVTTTLVLRVYGASQIPGDFHMPVGRILFEITVCLLLPLTLGMMARRYLPKAYEWIGRFCIRGSVVLLFVIIIGAITSGRVEVAAYGWRSPVALVAFGLISYYICFPIAYLLRMSLNDMITVGIEVVVRNAHLAILLKASLFPAVAGQRDPIADGVLYVILFYGGVSLVVGGAIVVLRRIELRVQEARAERRAAAETGGEDGS
jgi:BASS family bile acid:Na+ symporter